MPVYSPTTFNNGAAPGISATELNKLGNGIATCVQIDGSTAMTGALPISQTLSGADKVYLQLTATDGKVYQFIVKSADNSLQLWDSSDGKAMAQWYTDGVTRALVFDNGTATRRLVREFIGTNDPSTYATMSEGDRWRKV